MPGSIRFVLVETSHPGNVGAAARAMKVMGFDDLVLVDPQCALESEAKARASGAVDLVREARVVAGLDAALEGVRYVVGTSARAHRRLGPELVDLRSGAGALAGEAGAGNVAVLFGPERTGLDSAALTRCNRLWRIPTAEDYASLNLAAAVQVVAYEIRQALGAGVRAEAPPVAPAEDVAGLCAHFDRVARGVGYVAADAPRRALQRVQRLARRARLEPSEVKLLRGFLSAVEKQAPQERRRADDET